MMETIGEKDVVCVNDNSYATATVQEVNVIVNRNERKRELFYCLNLNRFVSRNGKNFPFTNDFPFSHCVCISNHNINATNATRQH